MITREELTKVLPADPETVRFLARVVESPPPVPDLGPCLMWTKATAKGYGDFYNGKVRRAAHLWLWEKLHGPVPDGFEVHHLCHEVAWQRGQCDGGHDCPHRACVAHLRLMTHRENMLLGNTFAARQAAQVLCTGEDPSGPHDLTDPANVYTPPGRPNERHCRACNRYRVAKHRRKVRQLRMGMARYGEQLTLIEP